jgi:tetratricopeptide (TPR) repeat protein
LDGGHHSVTALMPRYAALRPIVTCGDLARLVSALLLIVLVRCGPASAQMAMIDTVQSDFVKKPAVEQSTILADAVRGAWKGRNCTSPKVGLEKTYDNRSGGWLVSCSEGQDYWALVQERPKSAAVVLPCILARQSGTDCYANVRTVSPDDIEQCASSSSLLDRVIRSCTAIIQSHQFDSKPAGISLIYASRASAFVSYQQYDLAIADLDKAVALQPGHIDTRYNRAVILERKGEFDQALIDLAKVIEARPNDVNGLYERGYVYLKKGDYDRAIGDFDRVLRINPQFEKAIRNRAAAIKAKDGPPQAAAVEATPFPATSDEQAAYCMEASFGYAQRLTKLLAILRDNREKGRALLAGPNVSPTDRAQLTAQMTALNDSISSNDAKKKAWDASLSTFTSYLQKRDLFTKAPNVIASMSGRVRGDQEAVHSTYNACLRGCAPNDASCRRACDESADKSEASRRMLRCADVVVGFK